jgi:hypothetical protein
MLNKYFVATFFSFIALQAYALPNGNTFIDLIGQPASNPDLAAMITELEFTQSSSSFDRSSNTYELKSFESGIVLYFNQNFLLKEIHFYDSGYQYKSFEGKLPMNLKLAMHHTYFRNQYKTFDPDTFNQFIYRSRFVNGSAMVYFKGSHVEMVRIIGDETYINEQDRNQMSSWGIRLIPDGKCLEGNCYTGQGKMNWPTSLTFEGNWEFGIPYGEGQMSDSSGLAYSGSFRLGFLWGEGILKVPGQYTYKGNMLMGRRYGEGEIRYTNGSRYAGNWRNDMMHGKGDYHFSETYSYSGYFINNQFNGRGTLTTPEGYYEGQFKNGKPHGYGVQVATINQSTLTGKWVNGKKEGTYAAYNPLLGNYEVYFENDIEIKKIRNE